MARPRRTQTVERTSHALTPGQTAFLKRKVRELRQRLPPDRELEVTESTVLQGLVHLWMSTEKET